MAARSIACQVQNVKRVHGIPVEKVCQAISSIKLSSRNYIKPGRSSPLVKDVNTLSLKDSRRKIPRTSSDVNKSLGIGKSKCIGSSFPSVTFDVVDSGNADSRQSEGYTSMHGYSHSSVISGLSSNQTAHASPVNGKQNTFPDGIADDDIVENLDVDQIIMEHYQSTGTPQPSISKLRPFTPTVIKDNDARPELTCLPPELCVDCSHGLKLGLCSKAANHLRDMKDMLISISNDLLDNVSDLNPDQIEKLCQDSLQLNKQTQQLQKHFCATSVDEERQNSHFSASTAAPRTFNYDNPPTVAFRIDPMRLESQFHIRNEPDGCDRLNSSFGEPPTPAQREPYIRKYVDVKYTDGSNDKMWSSWDFPWTKKLEANDKKVFGNHSFRPNQREVINATMSRRDVFVLMPTGGGKSLTYQLPAYSCRGITLVISPLVSLIHDQIMHLLQANIPAAYLSANMEWTKQQEILRELCLEDCKYKLLYVTPDKVAN